MQVRVTLPNDYDRSFWTRSGALHRAAPMLKLYGEYDDRTPVSQDILPSSIPFGPEFIKLWKYDLPRLAHSKGEDVSYVGEYETDPRTWDLDKVDRANTLEELHDATTRGPADAILRTKAPVYQYLAVDPGTGFTKVLGTGSSSTPPNDIANDPMYMGAVRTAGVGEGNYDYSFKDANGKVYKLPGNSVEDVAYQDDDGKWRHKTTHDLLVKEDPVYENNTTQSYGVPRKLTAILNQSGDFSPIFGPIREYRDPDYNWKEDPEGHGARITDFFVPRTNITGKPMLNKKGKKIFVPVPRIQTLPAFNTNNPEWQEVFDDYNETGDENALLENIKNVMDMHSKPLAKYDFDRWGVAPRFADWDGTIAVVPHKNQDINDPNEYDFDEVPYDYNVRELKLADKGYLPELNLPEGTKHSYIDPITRAQKFPYGSHFTLRELLHQYARDKQAAALEEDIDSITPLLASDKYYQERVGDKVSKKIQKALDQKLKAIKQGKTKQYSIVGLDNKKGAITSGQLNQARKNAIANLYKTPGQRANAIALNKRTPEDFQQLDDMLAYYGVDNSQEGVKDVAANIDPEAFRTLAYDFEADPDAPEGVILHQRKFMDYMPDVLSAYKAKKGGYSPQKMGSNASVAAAGLGGKKDDVYVATYKKNEVGEPEKVSEQVTTPEAPAPVASPEDKSKEETVARTRSVLATLDHRIELAKQREAENTKRGLSNTTNLSKLVALRQAIAKSGDADKTLADMGYDDVPKIKDYTKGAPKPKTSVSTLGHAPVNANVVSALEDLR